MKILNIWFNPPIPDKYLRCIETQRKYFDGYEYEMIDRIKSLELLTQANEAYGGVNPVEEYISKPIPGSDYVRMYALSLEPDCLYIDCDVAITSAPPVFENTASLEYIERTDFFNNGIIYNANRCDIFDSFCKYWFTQKQLHTICPAVSKFAHDNKCDKIGPGWYTHYMYTARV
jgi:hypothetical protein